jgi:thiol-disulfide isomerase/thioredoxin
MKKNWLLLLSFLLCCNAYAQTVIENPTHGYCNEEGLKLTKIELMDTATILHFHLFMDAGFEMHIPEESFIQSATGGEKLVIRYAVGVPLNDEYVMPASGEVHYKLIFPPLGKHVKKFDYIEGEEGWTVFDIQTAPDLPWSSPIPQALAGHWVNTATGRLELSLYDNVAVYKKQLWSYGVVKLKNGSGSLQLENGTQVMPLFVTKDKNGSYRFGESARQTTGYSRINSLQAVHQPDYDKPFEAPVFKLDTAIYSGYIRNYRPHLGSNTILIRVNDLITGGENSVVGHIADNGYFAVKVPLYYPHEVYVETAFYYANHVFLEPGKTLFETIDAGKSLFMGDGATTNIELRDLKKINTWSHADDVNGKIPNITAAAYKAYWLNWQERDLRVLDSLAKNGSISPRTYQIKRKDLIYAFLNSIMEYEMLVEVDRQQEARAGRQRAPAIEADSLTSAYFDFVTDEVANDPLAVIAGQYYYFINRLKYLDLVRMRIRWSLSLSEVFAELEKTGYVFTAGEQQMQLDLKELESLQAQDDFRTRYKAQIEAFEKKYLDVYSTWAGQQSSPPTFSAIEKYLRDKSVKFTKEETRFIKAAKAYESQAMTVRLHALVSATKEPVNDFNRAHRDFLLALTKKMTNKSYGENLEELMGVKRGLVTDIITAQDYCPSIIDEKTPVSNQVLKYIQSQISSPFIANYVALRNEQTIQEIKGYTGPVSPGYDVSEQPKNPADSVFNWIIGKYKNKVIYVDFWATWCGPCRSDMAEIAPLKDDLEKENIAFVYITDQSSPKKAWSNMIPGIKGEHYRVSTDDWNYLCSKFNISGIPHHVLVGKDGKVINSNLRVDGNAALKKELMKHLNQ